ncbi:hypothetical protein BBP40_012039 [Aspergillus hancockii]|nr:hypothetical protein BBP40_012039 [Aspergillus hancockii]
MEQAPRPFPSPSPLVRSPPDDHMMMETNAVYSSPMPSTSNYSRNPQPTSGLGISHCEMESSASQLRLLSPETYPSVTDWSNQLIPPDSLLETTLDVGNFSPGTCYEPFGGHSDVSVSPLSYYSPQTLNASSSYGSAIEFGGNPGTLSAPSSGFWPNAPHSDAASCEIRIPVKEEPDESWEQLSLLTSVSESTGINTLQQMPEVMGDNTYSNNQHLPSNKGGTLFELKPNVERDGNSAVAQNRPVEVVFRLTKNDDEISEKRCHSEGEPTFGGTWIVFTMEFENLAVNSADNGSVDMTHSRGTRQMAATANHGTQRQFKPLSTFPLCRSKIPPAETNDDSPYRSTSCLLDTMM